jgi:Flp pilus assembly CpaF family ATPase
VPDALRAADAVVQVMADVYGERIGARHRRRDSRLCDRTRFSAHVPDVALDADRWHAYAREP